MWLWHLLHIHFFETKSLEVGPTQHNPVEIVCVFFCFLGVNLKPGSCHVMCFFFGWFVFFLLFLIKSCWFVPSTITTLTPYHLKTQEATDPPTGEGDPQLAQSLVKEFHTSRVVSWILKQQDHHLSEDMIYLCHMSQNWDAIGTAT